MDIIKSGGYKISGLEIESVPRCRSALSLSVCVWVTDRQVLLQHDKIRECAVVGKPDETWGEKAPGALTATLRLRR